MTNATALSTLADSPVIRTAHLTRRYHRTTALDGVDVAIHAGSITGLVGRNGSGKTTLLRLISGQEFPTSGSLEVFGQSPAENPDVQHRMVFVREDLKYPDFRVRHALAAASHCFPHWDEQLAASLLSEFDLTGARKIKGLSRGMRSAVGVVIGIAAHAELTLFDEPYAGLDPVARQIFYRRLLEDYTDHPRTIVISTHHVDEIAGLLEDIIVLDQGRVSMAAPADDVRGSAIAVSGGRDAVANFASGRVVWSIESLGRYSRAVVAGALTDDDRRQLRDRGLEIESVTLQQVLAHTTGPADQSTVGVSA